MGALNIDCFLNESQMTQITDYISKRLFSCRKDEIEDIDICFKTMNIRICVSFFIGLESVEIGQAEIMDNDWNTIDADSAVLRSRLKKIIGDYNYTEHQLVNYCL